MPASTLDRQPSRRATAPAGCCAPLAAPQLTSAEAAATARLFKALADPARVRLVNLLATSAEPICVCELTVPLGLAQPTVSHHLRTLREAGLVDCERRGTWAYYWLDRAAVRRLAAVMDLPEPVPPPATPAATPLEGAHA